MPLATVRSETWLAQKLADGLARPHTVLARVWFRTADRLRLSGSAGFPTGGGSYARLDGSFSSIPVGEGKIGRIAATGMSLIVPSLRGDEEWLANHAWIARQGVRSFAGYPLASGDEVLGVMAIFDRARPSVDDVRDHELLASFAALRLIELREREALMQRLAALEAAATAQTDLSPSVAEPPRTIITRTELRSIERDTLETALARTSGRVFGPHGAAILLGMKPTTLASRMRALGIPPARAIRRRVKDQAPPGDNR